MLFIPKNYDISEYMREGSVDTYVFCAPETI